MRGPRFILFFLSLGLGSLCSLAHGEEEEIADFNDVIEQMEDHYRDKPEHENTTLENLEDIHEDLSQDIEGLASRIDSFFVNENVIYGRNTTNVRLFNTLSMVEEQGVGGNLDFKVRLQLPRLKEKLQFEVDRQVEDYSVNGTGTGTSTANNTLVNTRNTNSQTTRAGFSFFGDSSKLRIRSKVTVGLEYYKGLDPFIRERLSRDFKLSKRQNISVIANFLAEATAKTRAIGTTYYDFAVRNNVLFRFLNEGTYKDIDRSFESIHSVNIFHEINDRNSMSYVAGIRGINPTNTPNYYLSEYFTGATLRHRLYKRFLYLETTPGVSWPKIKEFQSVLLFSLRLEVIFGQI